MTKRATAEARQAREAAQGCAADVAQKIADGCASVAGLIDRAASVPDAAVRNAYLADARQLVTMAAFIAGNLLVLQKPTGTAGDIIIATGRRDAFALIDKTAATTDPAERTRLLEKAEDIARFAARIEDAVERPNDEWLTADVITDACTTPAGTAAVVARIAKLAEDGSLARALQGLDAADAATLARLIARTRS